MPLPELPPSRFAADAMLGRLARWLRVLGYDTSYDESLADTVLVQLAAAERSHAAHPRQAPAARAASGPRPGNPPTTIRSINCATW